MKITVTIITLNEEANIGACLASLEWADEIVVVDSGSSDRTEEICRSNQRVRYFSREWEGFSRQKNMAAGLASNDWIFNIDADERVSPELCMAIKAADLSRFSGFRVARENYFGGQRIRYCGWYPDYNLRLYDRRSGSFGDRQVHESVQCSGSVGVLKGNLLHYSYRGIDDYLQRMNRYSTLAAREVNSSGRTPGVASTVVRPLYTFFKMFIVKKGFLDGYTGFVLSVLYGFYTFAKYVKARELQNTAVGNGKPDGIR